MLLNAGGNMVVKWWNELANKFPSVSPDIFVVMPNHFHGVIMIHETVGADLRVGPGDEGAHAVGADLCVGPSKMDAHAVGADLRVGPGDEGAHIKTGEHIVGADLCVGPSKTGEHIGSPLPINAIPLSRIMQWFKTMTTNAYIRGVKQYHWPPFAGKLWQRNYYEHIIRNEKDYERIFNYIVTNPVNWAEDEENR